MSPESDRYKNSMPIRMLLLYLLNRDALWTVRIRLTVFGSLVIATDTLMRLCNDPFVHYAKTRCGMADIFDNSGSTTGWPLKSNIVDIHELAQKRHWGLCAFQLSKGFNCHCTASVWQECTVVFWLYVWGYMPAASVTLYAGIGLRYTGASFDTRTLSSWRRWKI